MLTLLFPITLFLSAVLLFSIQPMVAKALLPIYGGTPTVWTVCMLFFQFILLISYGYIWLLSFFKKPYVWRSIHFFFALCSLITLPLVFHPLSQHNQPEWEILYNLLTQIGLPVLVVGASAPLLQFAYSQTRAKNATDPYFLYIASNWGSLLALISYPWIIERYLGLTFQFNLWNLGYYIYLGLLLIVLCTVSYQPLKTSKESIKQWPWANMLYWIYLGFVPCSLMLGVTLYITTDVAATPLFWILPLALYLLSFIITFSTKPLISQDWVLRNYMFFLIFTVLGFVIGTNTTQAYVVILIHLLSYFVLVLLCQGQLFKIRPGPEALTLFYFCMALGGVLAGIFNGIIAPHVFNQVYEYPLAILLCLFILPSKSYKGGWWVPLFIVLLMALYYVVPEIKGVSLLTTVAVISLILIVTVDQSKYSLIFSLFFLLGLAFLPWFNPNAILLQERNFYGVKQVLAKENIHIFISQSTLHGLQFMDEKKPISGFRAYYGPIKDVVQEMQYESNPLAATIVGLGTGTMLCQFRKEDQVTAVEIDQQVIDLAKNSKLFTYLRDCPPRVDLIKNDGRLALLSIPDSSQNILILDAFNSDAIPVHLMTREAFHLYTKKMTSDGALLVNLSNRHLNLLPVMNAMGHLFNLQVMFRSSPFHLDTGEMGSEWALLTSNNHLIQAVKQDWEAVDKSKQFLWTDDYSNIIPLLKWGM